ncbi:MAG: xanthine dehydrogenase family protein molybdopterin-binding subunit [Acidimicrobiia bacterium]|nr:xanthine dehydrogenase family protein molybdopterin-binding subunit [Acidimicrobiia bacterium]
MAQSGSILGSAVLRREDPAILEGQARYFDDLQIDGLLHIVFVRSTIAHATLLSVDTTAAADMPGVVAVYTAENINLAPIQGFVTLPAGFSRPPLATGRVRFVGDSIAAVVAETRAQAVDAAEQVVVDFNPLPVVVNAEAALADDAVLIHPEHGSNLASSLDFGSDPALLDCADVVVAGRFINQRLAAVPLENNGIVVQPTDEGGLICHVPTQGAHGIVGPIAGAVDLTDEQVRVIAPVVGGGFGAKAGMFVEYAVAAKAALLLDRPVKWTETRSENMVAMSHGRAHLQDVEMGLRRDGKIMGLRVKVFCDAGAYPGVGAFLPFLTRSMAQGPYVIPKVEFNTYSVATNTTTTASYRGAGRPEATALLERILDMAADELDIDPIEIRKINFIPPEAFPLTTVTGANYDVGEYALALDTVSHLAGYDELRADQAARRARGDNLQLGIGVSSYVEVTAFGQFQEYGSVEVHEDGTATAMVGTAAHGQGHETSFSMIVSDLLGIPMDKITLVQSDTALVPHGGGTGGSRSLQVGGSSIYRASEGVLAKAKALTAHLLEANIDDIGAHEGDGLGVTGVPARTLSWSALATAANDPKQLPEGMEPGLAHSLDFDQGGSTYPFGAHIAVVEVDMETGRVELLRHIAVDDCGRILNPLLVAGQQHGGIAQGVAQALWEEVCYDEDGNPLTTNLMDYPIPSAAELPSFEVHNTQTPTPLNPLGAKGIGESGTIGSTPAIQNAVVDALSHVGVRHIDMPMSSERVWRAIQNARVR